MYKEIVSFIRKTFNTPKGIIPLHEPRFWGNEKKYLLDCVDSTFVSSVGRYVDLFEEKIKNYTGSKYAIAITNGTSALHLALKLAGVEKNDLVISQPLSFIATSNAISYLGAFPAYVDVDKKTLGMSDEKLSEFLQKKTFFKDDGFCYHKASGKKISACVPMHTFGHPVKIDVIKVLCKKYNISLVEDAAESIGSKYRLKQTGTFGNLGIFSFNGNKTITCGGGGVIITDNIKLAKMAKHLSTQAKITHPWNFGHDEIGFNYRMPNINAALACAQLEQLENFIERKRILSEKYKQFFSKTDIEFFTEPQNSCSNYWLNSIFFKNRKQRDKFLKYMNSNGIMTRPSWTLMTNLKMYKNCVRENIENSEWIEERLVNIPSSVILKPSNEI